MLICLIKPQTERERVINKVWCCCTAEGSSTERWRERKRGFQGVRKKERTKIEQRKTETENVFFIIPKVMETTATGCVLIRNPPQTQM